MNKDCIDKDTSNGVLVADFFVHLYPKIQAGGISPLIQKKMKRKSKR